MSDTMQVVLSGRYRVSAVSEKDGKSGANIMEFEGQYPKSFFLMLPEGQRPQFKVGEVIELSGTAELVRFPKGGFGLAVVDYKVKRFTVNLVEVPENRK